MHTITLELLDTPPTTVDAGADVRFVVRAVCSVGCDLGAIPLVVEGAGADLASLTSGPASTPGTRDTEVVLRAPLELGRTSWIVRLPQSEHGGIPHSGADLGVTIDVVAHRTSLAIWQVPSPSTGSPFAIRVGVKCSVGCGLGGEQIGVHNDTGECLGEGTLALDASPGSEGLHEAEVTLVAPIEAGVFFRRVHFDGRGLAIPHEASESVFSFRALASVECTVTVRVVPESVALSLGGVEVRVGPYRAATNEDGIARVAVSRGTHVLTLWRLDITPRSVPIEVSSDMEHVISVAARSLADPDEKRVWM